ncbi:unnamed protein product [Pieris macdunnoughi]|uniref:HAT C-terminal dimerisation domain-containing protein n=1 Tax=Pieris macdunnoughi TaxID=345717 RepID=A0A821N9Y4_9NEOP|nr:unnamed protein product [Pieris macdunnoughi]
MTTENLKQTCESIAQFYDLPNIKNEIELWQHTVVDVLKKTNSLFPETEKALKILIALPCTTCTVELSFSSLRRLKTWLRSTMAEDRLNWSRAESLIRGRAFRLPFFKGRGGRGLYSQRAAGI